ncbi:MAG: hypothetical protein AAB877_03705 [Patescibacteria group bacterium]
MKKNHIFILCLAVFLTLPFLVLAQLPQGQIELGDIEGIISDIVSFVWIVFVGIVVISFLVAGTYFLTSQGEPEKIRTARRFAIWGAIGVLIAVIGYSAVQMVQTFI